MRSRIGLGLGSRVLTSLRSEFNRPNRPVQSTAVGSSFSLFFPSPAAPRRRACSFRLLGSCSPARSLNPGFPRGGAFRRNRNGRVRRCVVTPSAEAAGNARIPGLIASKYPRSVPSAIFIVRCRCRCRQLCGSSNLCRGRGIRRSLFYWPDRLRKSAASFISST